MRLADGCCDLDFMSMVFHHIADRGATARECRQLCHDNGHVCFRQPSQEQVPYYPYLSYFLSVEANSATHLPAYGEVMDAFTAADFTPLAQVAVDH